jgi:hypothetical protein
MPEEKPVIGLVEIVEVVGVSGKIRKKALFDTGATRSCIDVRTAARVGLGPIVSSVKIKSASAPKGYMRRAIVEATIVIKGKPVKTRVNLEDREGLPYSVLIGRDVIHNNFIIDVSKSNNSIKAMDVKIKQKEVGKSGSTNSVP